MRRIVTLELLTMALLLGWGLTTALADPSGDCSITADRHEGRLQFSVNHPNCNDGGHCNEYDSGMSWSRWSGITPSDLQREGASIDARLNAEAGEMHCVGTVHEAALRGTYSFTPHPEFVQRMEALGFHDQTTDRLRGYTMLDVTIEWTKSMKDLGIKDMTSDNLMGLKALGVDPAYVRGMANAGYPELEAGKLTSMKAVGVSPEKVQQVRDMGYKPTEEELIQMSVFKIDGPFVASMKARGFKNLTIAQLVQIKVFKLDE